MANLSKIKRDKMIAFLEELKKQHSIFFIEIICINH